MFRDILVPPAATRNQLAGCRVRRDTRMTVEICNPHKYSVLWMLHSCVFKRECPVSVIPVCCQYKPFMYVSLDHVISAGGWETVQRGTDLIAQEESRTQRQG